MTDDQEKEILGRIKETTNMADLKEVDFVIEAVLEDLNLKKRF
jgi:3-hydroxybutyryl-CoA dehydrogenase